MGSVRKLSEEEIQERLSHYSKRPDPKVRDEVVLQYANLVESIARRFVGACEPLEDLSQEGYIGLIASVDKYDGGKGVKFSTYATHFIIGQIKHYLRDKGKIIKEPAWLQELNQRMSRVIESLNQKLGRQPTDKEIGEVMQMPESTVAELLTTREVFKVSSLDGDKDDNSGTHESEKIGDQKVVTFQLPIEDKIVLETALDNLKSIEQQVISEHFYRGLNQTEIAKQLGISCNYVSHILRNGTKKLKKILITEEIRDNQMQRTLVSQRTATGEAAASSASVLDPVTGIYSSDYLSERLGEELSRAYRDHYNLSVLLINVQLPGEVDNYVRLAKTEDLLYAAAQSMRTSIRKMDVLAKLGDNCFALILPHTGSHSAAVAERLKGIVSSVAVDSGRRGSKLHPEVQIGVARYPKHAADADQLLEAAANDMNCSLEELRRPQTEQLRKAA